MGLLYLDTETFSPYDVTKYGVDIHARSAEIILASYAIDDGPVYLWEKGEDLDHFLTRMAEADRLIAHNAWFDRSVLEAVGWCDRELEAWHCTMAQAYAHALPGSLDALGRYLGLPADMLKRPDGKRLMRLFCKPQRNGSRLTKNDLPAEWEQFCDYAYQDAVALREVHKRLPRVNLHECLAA